MREILQYYFDGFGNVTYEFICLDDAKQGKLSHSGAFELTLPYKKLFTNLFNFPNNSEAEENLNFVMIGDCLYPLQSHLLKLYPEKNLSI